MAIPTDGSTPTHNGWVAENNDNDNYNFYGDSSTSLNQMFDRDEFARVAGEDDLVAIRIDPVSGASSGDMTQIHYTSPNIRLWRNADKSGWSILSDMPTFNALTTTTIYVEGLKLSGAVNAEKIDLMYASANASVPPFILSTVAFTVYKVTGAANVPGYSKHVYEATIPGPNGATYGPVVNGSIIQIGASVPAPGGGATVNTVSVKWDEGAVVGTLQVNAPGGKFSFTKQVNVVKVNFVDGADNKLVLDNSWQAQNLSRRGVNSSNVAPPDAAMYGSIRVSSVAGPADPIRPGMFRGQRFIDFGSMQTVTIEHLHGDYGNPKAFTISNPLEGKTFIDVGRKFEATKPWFRGVAAGNEKGQFGYFAVGTDAVYGGKLLDMLDPPDLSAVPDLRLYNVDVSFFSIVLHFDAMFAVHTKEMVNGADLSYTIRATAHWDWNGSGKVTVNPGAQYDWSRYVWTSSFADGKGHSVTSFPANTTKFAISTEGNIVLPTLTQGQTGLQAMAKVSVNVGQGEYDWKKSP